MKYKFDYSEEKNELLKESRGLGFEEIIHAIDLGNLIKNKINPNQKKYPRQRLFIVKIESYVYTVPYVTDRKRHVYFLKTLYPSRKYTKQYIKKL